MKKENDKQVFVLSSELRKGINSINTFANIYSSIISKKYDQIIVDLCNMQYIHPHYAVLIAAIPYISQLNNVSSIIKVNTHNDKFKEFLNKTGIFSGANILDQIITPKSRKMNKVPFIALEDENQGLKISEKIINSFPIEYSEAFKSELISIIYEIISNSFTHSESKYVFCCGCLDNKRDFHFSIFDFGIGIPAKVKSFKEDILSDKEALMWAWEKGNSTLNGRLDYPRGAGLDLLKEFTHTNNGDLFMVSGNSYCKITSKGDKYEKYENDFLGTFFSMTIKRDIIHTYSNFNNLEG